MLKNRKLKENTFLIIDEPEVNLHPDWQLKFAEILVLLASELNIIIYLNSHSPLFIEAIDTFSKFYNVDDETNYYLTEKSNYDCFTLNRVKSSELYKIYDNLAKAYEDINFINLKIEYGYK